MNIMILLLFSTLIKLSGLVAAAFGMNLISSLESQAYAFQAVVACLLLLPLLAFRAMRGHARRKNIF